MQAEGLHSVFPMSDLTVAGFVEVIPRLPRLAMRLFQTLRAVETNKPSIVVGIDSKGFNLRVLRALACRRASKSSCANPLISNHSEAAPELSGVVHPLPKLVQYVAPSAWAFSDAKRRASSLRGWLDHLLVLLPFEKELFSGVGVPCTFVGHPALESTVLTDFSVQGANTPCTKTLRAMVGESFRKAHGFSPTSQMVCLLPGSRPQEVHTLLPLLLHAAARMESSQEILQQQDCAFSSRGGIEFFILAAPGVRQLVNSIARRVLPEAAHAAALPHVCASGSDQNGASSAVDWLTAGKLRCAIVDAQSREDAFAASTLALAACGTVNIELAAAGVPQVAIYRTSHITSWIIRNWLRPVLRHATLPNILAGRTVIAELLFEQCTPERIAEEAIFILANPSVVASEVEQIRRLVLPKLQPHDSRGNALASSEVAARTLLKYLPKADCR